MNFFIIIWQETINFVSEKNLYVRVVAGINVLTREAHWEFQSLDPLTGSWLFTSQKDLQLASDDKHDHDLCQNENFTCISQKKETTNGTVKFHKNAVNMFTFQEKKTRSMRSELFLRLESRRIGYRLVNV